MSYALLCAVSLSSCSDVADTEEHSQNETVLVDPDTTVNERYSRSPQRPKSANTATKNQDTKTSEPKRRSDDLQSSSSVARSAAKSPLVLRLLQEHEPADISNQLAYSPLAQLHHEPEQETGHYQQAPQENAGGVLEYAEPEYGTPTHKEIGVRNCLYILWLLRAELPSSLCVVFIAIVRDRKRMQTRSQNARSLSYNIIFKP